MTSLSVGDQDPLDGTKEFTEGLKEYVTVLLGITRLGKPLAGVVHVPFAEPSPRNVYGAVGVGVWGARDTPKRDTKRVIATSRSRPTSSLRAMIDKQNFDSVVPIGGAGSKGLLTLDGEVDAYWYPVSGTSLWDTAAIDAILRAAGGKLTDTWNDDIDYNPDRDHYVNDQGVIATKLPEEQHRAFCLQRS